MTKNEFGVAIMAAGKGTRLKSQRPKVLHEVGGQALLLHVIAAAKAVAPADKIWCIVGHEAERVHAAVEATGVRFVVQAEQRGTGHALQTLKAEFAAGGSMSAERPPENLLVLSGDVPLIAPETLKAMCEFHLREQAAMTILTAEPADPTGYGRVIRAGGPTLGSDETARSGPSAPPKRAEAARSGPGAAEDGAPSSVEVLGIVEQKALKPEQLGAREINSGIYCFRTSALLAQLDSLSTNNAHGEYYLTDVAALLVAAGERVVAIKAAGVDEVLGANTIAEMMHLDAAMRLAKARSLMAQGVTIFRPDTCVIDAQVEVGADTVIEPYVQLLGATKIGSECRIRSYSVLQDSVLGEHVLVRNGCILEEATVGDRARLGPCAHLRAGSEIGEAARVGNFVETKKVRMGKGSKANHLSYLGDAVIGEGVNIGAGAITCNYDGAHKHTTTLGDGVFVGSDSTLVAPLTVGAGSYIAAGSCITEDVPPDSLALGRNRQTTKPGWVAARRKARSNE